MKVLKVKHSLATSFNFADSEEKRGSLCDFLSLIFDKSRVYDGALSQMSKGWKMSTKLNELADVVNKEYKDQLDKKVKLEDILVEKELEVSDEEFKMILQGIDKMSEKNLSRDGNQSQNPMGGKSEGGLISSWEAYNISIMASPWKEFLQEIYSQTDEYLEDLKKEAEAEAKENKQKK